MKLRIIVLVYTTVTYFVYKEGYISIEPEILFVCLSLILTAYLLIEIIRVRKNYIKSPWLNPVVLSSIFTFILGFGIVNIVFLFDGYYNTLLYNRFGNEPYSFLNVGLFLVIIGAVSLWVGYDIKAGERFYNYFINLPLIKKLLKKEFSIKKGLLLLFYLLSVLFRLYAIRLGIYGYSEDETSVTQYANIDLFINMFGQLGNFVLLILALSYFSKRDKSLIPFMAIVFVGELFFGFISGSKVAVVTPVLIFIISDLIINKRIRKSYIFATLVLVIAAYVVIEPFRYLRYYDKRFRSDLSHIVNTIEEAQKLKYVSQIIDISQPQEILLTALMRNNYAVETAKAIDFNDNVGLKEGDPDFKYNLLTIPLQAYIPKIIWPTKPITSLGNWFTRNVWGYDQKSSTAMTPFGFLYFTGGVYLIIPFFIIFGIMCKFLYQFLRLNSGGILIYLGLIATLIFIDSMVNAIFVTWLRSIPILLFLQYVVFKK